MRLPEYFGFTEKPSPSDAVTAPKTLCQRCGRERDFVLKGELQDLCYKCTSTSDTAIILQSLTMPDWVSPLAITLETVQAALRENSEQSETLNSSLAVARKLAADNRAERVAIETQTQAFEKSHATAMRELQNFLSSGRACEDCRKTRVAMFASLNETLQKLYEQPADPEGDKYASRAAAYQAGRQYTILALQNIIKNAIEREDYRDVKSIQSPA